MNNFVVADAQKIPTDVHMYHTLFPLESSTGPSKIFGYQTSLYKACSSVDGNIHVLRRIEGFILGNEASLACIEQWRSLIHANIVGAVEAFTTKAFGDTSLVIVYDYHPNSVTLSERWLSPRRGRNDEAGGVSEVVLWGYICQITGALKTIHSRQLAARVIDPTKIIITEKNRFVEIT